MDTESARVSNVLRSALGRRAAGFVAALAVVAVLGACGPIVLTTGEPPEEVTLTARASGGMFIVLVPEHRPSKGIVVRQSGGRNFRIPPGHYPPPGQCRIWRPDVPPGQQDPPGECAQLERSVPPGAYLVDARPH